jgi:diguanylate cyclase (GGDEF)-like protein/PAS domain S-box-containing protein
MDLHSGVAEALEAHGLTSQPGEAPSLTLPPGPRRIHQRRGWRRLRRVGLAALVGVVGGAVAAWSLAGELLPPHLTLPQPAGALPAQDLFVPMLLAALGLVTLWRLSVWVLPLAMAGLLLGCGLPLLALPPARALDLLPSTPLLATLALPLMAVLLHRRLLRRIGLSGRLAHRRETLLFGLLAGLAAPLLAGLLAGGLLLAVGVTQGGAATVALELATGWSLALLSAGTALQASTQGPRQVKRWTSAALGLTAVATLAALPWLPEAALLLPPLLLALHALQAAPRTNALLGTGLLTLWALTTPAAPVDWVLGALLAVLPLAIVVLSRHQLRDRDAWRRAIDAQGLALAEWRLPEGQRQASARWLTITTPSDAIHAGGSGPLDWLRLAHPRDRDAARQALRQLMAEPDEDQLDMPLRLAADGGDWRWHELKAHVPQRDRQGRAVGLIATLADASWRHTAEERERMAATLFQVVGEGLAVIDAQGRVVEANPGYCEILHKPREALIGRPATPLTAANLCRNGQEPAVLATRLSAGQPWAGELEVEFEEGGLHTFEARISPVPEPGAASPRWRVLAISDIGERLSQQEQLQRSRRYDAATGLPNRDEFMRLLQQAMAAASRDGFRLIVGVIDLDDFGRVNVEHGPLVADAALLELSGRLQAALRGARGAAPDTADQLARLHGDEFALLMRVQSREEAQRAVARLLALLSMPVAVRESRAGDGLALEVGGSVGATLYPQDESDPETLLRHAGHALYRAKQSGRGGVQFHDPSLDPRDEAGLIALARVQQALDGEELLLHYQPQIDLRSGQVMGVEALLRWQHPERGLLAPAHFLPAIENSGLAVQIGDWVIEQALMQAAAWLRQGLRLPVSVNVGARQLSRPDFPQRLQELIRRQPSEVAHLLNLDVLESDALAETAAAQALIQRCMALGVGIALDDFGAGYSRLSSLKQLPVDTLKVDRSFVQGMLGDAQDLSLVESVIGLARNIGCAVLAKGVESRAHARELLRLGCRLGQGNGIAAAMHPMALPGWMEAFANGDWVGQLRAPVKTGP